MADINVDMSNLEPNSHKYKAEKNREKIQPVINKNQVVSTKKPFGKKISETFMTEDAKDIKTWLIMDVLIPGVKSTILDIISMMFFGELSSSRNRSSSRSRNGRTNYSSIYRDSYDRNERNRRRRDDSYESDDNVDFRNIVLRERRDAERLIEEARRRIRDSSSQAISIAELLDLIDAPSRYTDCNWGWDDERDIGIRRVSSGYLIDVAEPKYIG